GDKGRARVLARDAQLEPTLPALLSLLGAPVADPAWERLDPPRRRQRTLESVRHLLLRESQAQPLLLVFEDLHWIDGETQALLESLVDSLPASAVLVIASYRPEYSHGSGSQSYYR